MDSGSNLRAVAQGGSSLEDSYCSSKRYVKKKVINKSLYGMVYLGLDTMTNQEVAIKSSDRVLAQAKTLPDGTSLKEDIIEEIRLHRKLSDDPESCPYIIKLLNVVRKKDTIDLVVEYAARGDLFTYMKDKTTKLNEELAGLRGMPEYKQLLKKHWEEVLKLIKQILVATAYLHARNISHRDISLENILLDSDGNIKLIDFGNAREYADTNWLSERGPIGKPGYLSPECFASEFYDGRDNDMWCIGVILWQMLIGAKIWYDPEIGDARFKYVYFEGLRGLQRLLNLWNLNDRLPPYCRDFIIKIFCPQKCRLTVKEALAHPYITNSPPSDGFVLRNVPIQVSVEPDYHLKRLAHRTRYESVEIPESWVALDTEQREKIINQLTRVNGNTKSTVLDRSVVHDVAKEVCLEIPDARAIIHYLWASSQHPSQVKFPEQMRTEGNLDLDAGKHDVKIRGYDVDMVEDQKCDLSIHEHLDVHPSVSVASCDQTLSEVSRGRWRAKPSAIKVVTRNLNVPLKGDREKRLRSPGNVSKRKTYSRQGGFLVSTRDVSKSGGNREKSLSKRPRRRGRCFSEGNKSHSTEIEHFVEGDEPRSIRRNLLNTTRALRHDRENQVIRHREKKIHHSSKLKKQSKPESIFTLKALAKV